MNHAVLSLMIKARRSLDAANFLRDRGDHDFAASRAYYSMFYVAEALLETLGQSYSSHSATIGAFGKEFPKTELLDPKFHRQILLAQIWRNAGDYQADVLIAPDRSGEVCQWAAEFIGAADKYLDSLNL